MKTSQSTRVNKQQLPLSIVKHLCSRLTFFFSPSNSFLSSPNNVEVGTAGRQIRLERRLFGQLTLARPAVGGDPPVGAGARVVEAPPVQAELLAAAVVRAAGVGRLCAPVNAPQGTARGGCPCPATEGMAPRTRFPLTRGRDTERAI